MVVYVYMSGRQIREVRFEDMIAMTLCRVSKRRFTYSVAMIWPTKIRRQSVGFIGSVEPHIEDL